MAFDEQGWQLVAYRGPNQKKLVTHGPCICHYLLTRSMEQGGLVANGVVDLMAVIFGYGCAAFLGWVRARTSAQVRRDRETKRQEMIRSLPLGSRVLDIDGTGMMVEVGNRELARPKRIDQEPR